MIKSVFNTTKIPVPRKLDFSNQMQILILTDKLATIDDFFWIFEVEYQMSKSNKGTGIPILAYRVI